MFRVEKNNIVMSKGDTGKFNLTFKNGDGTDFVPSENDEIVFSVKKRKSDLFPIMLVKSGCEIVIGKDETENIPSGIYVYDVTVSRAEERQTAVEGFFEIRDIVHALK